MTTIDTDTLERAGLHPRIVVASGRCGVCDFDFREEEVLAYDSESAPAGVAYVELRHLGTSATDGTLAVSRPD